MAFVIAVSNQKGGVGKTTTTVNLGAALAERGRNVLLVDLDPHAGLTKSLGFDPDEIEHTSFHALTNDQLKSQQLIKPLNLTGLAFVPASEDLAVLEVSLRMDSSRFWQLVLRDFLEQVKQPYDYVLIDCPPALGVLTINALTAANAVLVPVQLEFLALDAVNTLEAQVTEIRARTNPKLCFQLVRTMWMVRRRHHAQGLEVLEKNYPGLVLRTVIPNSIRFPDSCSFGQSLIHYEPSHKGAHAYRELAKEIEDLWPSPRPT